MRVYQDDSQGETRGLNPPITYETKKKLLKNRVTCNLMPELRCLVKNPAPCTDPLDPTTCGAATLKKLACDTLYEMGDDYCDHIEHTCSLNNAGNPEGVYGLSDASLANMANQRLSLYHGMCCIDALGPLDKKGLAVDRPICRHTPKTRLPAWILESEYFQDPVQGPEGFSSGLAGTNPAGWKTYGMGLPYAPPNPPQAPMPPGTPPLPPLVPEPDLSGPNPLAPVEGA